MGENQKNKKLALTKESIITGVIGLVIGIGVTLLICFCIGSGKMARLRYGSEAIASVNGTSISTEKVYNGMKTSYGLKYLLNEVDKAIVKDMYTLTEKEEEDIKKEAKQYVDYYTASGKTEQDFLEAYGFSNYDEFLDDIRASLKSTKYLYDYLEGKLETGAVKKYYDENKDDLETYDSEHILVKITDDVTDEQALALANEIIAKLDEGKSFSEVVEEYKDKTIHEELGYQGKDASLEQTYIDEIVALKDGEYSKTPVKTSYGYHIVHKLATSTYDDLRGTIIEKLATDLLNKDSALTDKAFFELRKDKDLKIYDERLEKQYNEYCDSLSKS